ncbi:MAG: hypothetical protein ABIF85_06625 [Nanoarchaeota archaeon]|nr:hypothetical protein [Nanoarchaeota archaeon]MBU4451324.1 hypothetical protein [Nanoarchaeota archaeon]MCG2723285.1 hypothetical protein [archaeon]
MVEITGKSKYETEDYMLTMLMMTIVSIVIIASLFVGAAIRFNNLSIFVVSVFFQMLTLGAVLLNAMFLVKIEQKYNGKIIKKLK